MSHLTVSWSCGLKPIHVGVYLKPPAHKTLRGNYDAKAGTGGPESLQILEPVAIYILLPEPCHARFP